MTNAIDWTAVGSAATGVAVVVAVIALVQESRAARFGVAVEMIMRLNDQFESEPFRRIRSRAAVYLRNRATADSTGEQCVYDVLNFFSMVAFLHERKALDLETVWFTFAYYLIPYCRLAQREIDALRAREPLSYMTVDRLNAAVLRLEEQRRGREHLKAAVSSETDEAFLLEEAVVFSP